MFSFWSSKKTEPARPPAGADSARPDSSPSTSPSSPASTAQSPATPPTSVAPAAYPRPPPAFQPLGIFIAGISFFAIAQVITRRSMVRRYKSVLPPYFHPSNQAPGGPVNGAMEAFDALNIATVNVLSSAMMVGGGLLWAFDIRSLPELRWRIRLSMGILEETNESAEEDFQEWLATTLTRKAEKEKLKERPGAGKDGR